MITENKNKTIFFAYLYNISAKFADILFFLLVVKYLTKDDVGLFNTIMAASGFFYILLSGGLIESAFREMAEKKQSLIDVFRKSWKLRAVIVLLTLTILASIIFFESTSEILISVLYAFFFQVASFLQNLMFSWLKASDRQSTANALILLESLLKLICIVYFILFKDLEIVYLWGAIFGCKLCMLFVAFFMTNLKMGKKLFTTEKSKYLCYEGQTFFLFLTFLTLLQNRLDWFLIGFYLDQEDVAIYSVANRFYEIIIFILGVGATTIYPWLCKFQRSDKDENEMNNIDRLFRFQMYIAIAVIPITTVFFPIINNYVWDGRYNEVGRVLALLLPCLLLAVTNMKLYYQILAARGEKYILIFSLVTTFVQAIFNFFAIKVWGINGAIMGMWLLNGLNVIIYSILVSDYKLTYSGNLLSNGLISFIMAFGLLVFCGLLPPMILLTLCFIIIIAIFIWEGRNAFLK